MKQILTTIRRAYLFLLHLQDGMFQTTEFHYMLRQKRRRFPRLKNFDMREVAITSIGIAVAAMLLVLIIK